jgi:hypothetical protein
VINFVNFSFTLFTPPLGDFQDILHIIVLSLPKLIVGEEEGLLEATEVVEAGVGQGRMQQLHKNLKHLWNTKMKQS